MVKMTGLKTVLKKFDENGSFAKCGDWSIANGGYDLWWEIYYQGYTVLQCVDGEITGEFRPIREFDEDAEKKLIDTVRSIYTDLK